MQTFGFGNELIGIGDLIASIRFALALQPPPLGVDFGLAPNLRRRLSSSCDVHRQFYVCLHLNL
jgi:hypothetical protein